MELPQGGCESGGGWGVGEGGGGVVMKTRCHITDYFCIVFFIIAIFLLLHCFVVQCNWADFLQCGMNEGFVLFFIFFFLFFIFFLVGMESSRPMGSAMYFKLLKACRFRFTECAGHEPSSGRAGGGGGGGWGRGGRGGPNGTQRR